jgi:hypothetical protein
MAEQLLKFSPHRDLQCYYFQPSAIAAMSSASATGFTVSGSWRDQWDWAVVEWNRDNVFEHPLLRYLPDLGASDLSGLTLSYVEERTNCVPLESNIYPSLDWPYLRIWVPQADGTDKVYYVRLSDPQYWSVAPGSSYQSATVTMTLSGTVTPGVRVGLAFMGTFASPVGASGAPIEQHYYYVPAATDTTLAAVATGLANAINAGSQDISASVTGNSITCTYVGAGAFAGKTGANGNRVGVYGFIQSGSQTSWVQQSATFSGGKFPAQYQMTLPFGNLQGVTDPSQFFGSTVPYVTVPTQNVRKVRWTWAADLQPGTFQRTEFQVLLSQWTVIDNNRVYSVAGPGSRRIEDDDSTVVYSQTNGASDWAVAPAGNYSGSRIQWTETKGATCRIAYSEVTTHQLYVGARRCSGAASMAVSIDGGAPVTFNLALGAEDILVRVPLGRMSAGNHTIVIAHSGQSAGDNPSNSGPYPLYFDFLEIAYPSQSLPAVAAQSELALATDWDTLHSQALAPERTAWLIWQLGFHGRVNHYVGAIWWYELTRPGQQFATVTATITAPSSPAGYTEIDFGSAPSITTLQHLNLPDDTAATIAQALAQRINQGTTAVWASASGNVLTITWRFIQTDPANPQSPLQISSSNPNGNVLVSLSASSFEGGTPGTSVGYGSADPLQVLTDYWRTDLTYSARLNRACRDWSTAFFAALKGYGIDCVATFSTELAHVDPTPAAGMAQRYPDGASAILSTPAIQTNFSPASLSFWEGVYTNMAGLQSAAGMTPYLQSGEVQWWYFPDASGMPYYDAYTRQQFTSTYNSQMGIITSGTVAVSQFPREAQLLPKLLGNFTAAIRTALRAAYPNARYEVLYPGDVNNSSVYPFNAAVNLPVSDWTPSNLTCFKTEGLTFALPPAVNQLLPGRSLDASLTCLEIGASLGFSATQRSHLVGITDAQTAWMKEVDLAQAQGMESVVLFALDQFCLIGYPLPPFIRQRWSKRAA